MYRLVHVTALHTLCSEGDKHTPAPAAEALVRWALAASLLCCPFTCFPAPLHLAPPPIPLLLLHTGGARAESAYLRCQAVRLKRIRMGKPGTGDTAV